jgi:hypothetical protein
MFRKLTVVLCLISFAPAAVGAQGLAALAAPPVAVAAAPETSAPATLALPAKPSESIVLASADAPQGTSAAHAPEGKKASHSSFNWGNFAEVHLGDYRWVWWVGAIAALAVIHVGAKD